MIENTGNGLHIVVATETALDWPTFACWYSAQKSMPDAKVSVVVTRTTKIDLQYYQWLKRLKVPHRFQNPQYRDKEAHRLQVAGSVINDKEVTMVVSPWTMFLTPLNDSICRLASSLDGRWAADDYCLMGRFVSPEEVNAAIDRTLLGEPACIRATICLEAKEAQESWPVVGLLKGCGKWLHTMTGCPFSSAAGMVAEDMTCNEWKIIEQWRRMVPLYSAVH